MKIWIESGELDSRRGITEPPATAKLKPILELARTFFEPHFKSDYADTEVIPPFAQRLTGFVSVCQNLSQTDKFCQSPTSWSSVHHTHKYQPTRCKRLGIGDFILIYGYWVLDFRYWILINWLLARVSKHWAPHSNDYISTTEYQILNIKYWISTSHYQRLTTNDSLPTT